MKRSRVIALIILVVAIVVGVTGWLWARDSREQQDKREAAYDAIVRQYASDLKPGMSRADVEAYLDSKRIKPRQMCCVSQNEGAYDDLVLIGHENPPWYCSDVGIFVALQFNGPGPALPARAAATDILRNVSLYRWAEGCL